MLGRFTNLDVHPFEKEVSFWSEECCQRERKGGEVAVVMGGVFGDGGADGENDSAGKLC